MKKIIFFVLFFIFKINCFSQNDSTLVSGDSLHIKQKRSFDTCAFHFPLVVKTDPVALIDLYNGGSAVLVAESFPLTRLSVSMEVGTYYNLSGYGMKSFHGWRSAFEVRYYFNENPTWDYFCGARYFYKKNGFTKSDSIQLDLTQGKYARTYLVRKDVTVCDFIFGKRKFNPAKNFTTELYCGIGVRLRNASTNDLSSAEIDHRISGESLGYGVIMKLGNSVYPDFSVGFRIGFGATKNQ